MSCDFAVWFPHRRLDDESAGEFYRALCTGDTSCVEASTKVDAFYVELTARHPELDDVPEDRIDDHDYCPWSIAFDRSSAHLIMCCVWSKAEYVERVVKRLAAKHGLVVYDPQAGRVTYPPLRRRESRPAAGEPWWKFW